MAHSKHEEVRRRYESRCGYCGVHESDAGGEFTIDHFRPISGGGDEQYENLVYSCFRCNLYKADYYAPADKAMMNRALIHPILEDSVSHYRLKESSGELVPLSDRGRFHITLLHLNRPTLVQYRLSQYHSRLLAEQLQVLTDQNRELQAIIEAQQRYIDRLRELLGSDSETGSP